MPASEPFVLPAVSVQESQWRDYADGLTDDLRRQVELWQLVPRVSRSRPQWHLVLVIDSEPVVVRSCESLEELVRAARSVARLEERWTQIFCFYGHRFFTERGPSKRLILSRTHRIPLVPLDRRRDLEADPEGILIETSEYRAARDFQSWYSDSGSVLDDSGSPGEPLG